MNRFPERFRKSSKTRFLLLAFALLIVFTGIVFANEQLDKSSPLLGGSGHKIVLGESIISSEADFLKFLRESDDYSGIVVRLIIDLEFKPVDGVVTKPNFKGIFDGGGHSINFSELEINPFIGNLQGGQIHNLTFILPLVPESFPQNQWLYATGTPVTIEGVTFTSVNPFHFNFGNVTPNIEWFNGSSLYNITSVEDLAGLAVLSRMHTFDGDTFNLTTNLDLTSAGVAWPGIGGFSSADIGGFRGTFNGNGHTISNLTSSQSGLFGYISGAEINGVNLLNVNVNTSGATGALVSRMSGSKVTSCSSSGVIRERSSGSFGTGGLIGRVQNDNIAPSTQLPSFITKSYSTVNITGSSVLGGLVGDFTTLEFATDAPLTIQTCFYAGEIDGVNILGGLVGSMHPANFSYPVTTLTITNSAVFGRILGMEQIGGFVGEGDYTVTTLKIHNSYIAGDIEVKPTKDNLYAPFSFADASLGTDVQNSYSSGRLILDKDISNYNEDFSGTDVYFDPHTVYSPENIMNMDESLSANPRYEAAVTGTGAVTGYFSGSPNASIPGFRSASLVVGTRNGGTFKYVQSGKYPVNPILENAGRAFKAFSDITTNAGVLNLPRTYYVNKEGYLSTENPNKNANAPTFILPTNGDFSWSFADGMSIVLNISSSDSAVTTLTLEPKSGGFAIKSDSDILQAVDVVLNITSENSLPGFRKSVPIGVLPSAYGPLGKGQGGIPGGFYPNMADAKKGAVRVDENERHFSIQFPAAMENYHDASSDQTMSIVEYVNGDPANKVVLPQRVKVRRLGDRTIVMSMPSTIVFNPNSVYMVNFKKGVSVSADKFGFTWEQEYYFMVTTTSEFYLQFDDNYHLADPAIGGSTSGDNQLAIMKENDLTYISPLDGIVPRLGTVANFSDLVKINFVPISTMAGKEPYAQFPAATVDNFHNIPGEYKLTYIARYGDRSTAPITRTYRIFGDTKLMQNGKDAITPIFNIGEDLYNEIMLHQDDTTFATMLAGVLHREFVQGTGTDSISAVRYGYSATQEILPIAFDTASINRLSFEDFGQPTVIIKVDNGAETFYGTLMTQQDLPDIKLEVVRTSYSQENWLSKVRAQNHISARAVKSSDPTVVLNERIVFDFDDVKPYAFDVAQKIPVYIKGYEDHPSERVREATSTVIEITIVKDTKWRDLTPVWDVSEDFWQGKATLIRETKSGNMLDIPVTYSQLQRVPRDFLIVVANKEDFIANLVLENGTIVTLTSENIHTELLITGDLYFNLALSPVDSYELYQSLGRGGFFAFATEDVFTFPGTVQVTLPIQETSIGGKMYVKQGTAYNTSDLDFELNEEQDAIVFELSEFEGTYILTNKAL